MTPHRWISVVVCLVFLSFTSISQAQSSKSVKRSVATVFFATLGGAVLGLSTLSFYGDPQEHTGNITTGALMGALVGAGYLAYDSSRPVEKGYDYSQSFDEAIKSKRALANIAKAPFVVSYKFDF